MRNLKIKKNINNYRDIHGEDSKSDPESSSSDESTSDSEKNIESLEKSSPDVDLSFEELNIEDKSNSDLNKSTYTKKIPSVKPNEESDNDSDSSSDEETINDIDYKLLPKMLVKIKVFLKKQNIKFSGKTLDGRTNSSLDEDIIIDILINSKYSTYVILPEIKRCWYDIIICDQIYGKIPVNIKTTMMDNSDNVGNLAIAVQAYTNYNLNLEEKCDNGKASKILYTYLKNGKINTNIKKDYFFLVFNKNNSNNIYINSVLGLKKLTRNNNNLPFQVKWNDNKYYELTSISEKVEMFKKTIKGKLPWKIDFLLNMNKL
jgi:hypothetical protein